MGMDDSESDNELDPEAIARANLRAEVAMNRPRSSVKKPKAKKKKKIDPRRLYDGHDAAYDLIDEFSVLSMDIDSHASAKKPPPASAKKPPANLKDDTAYDTVASNDAIAQCDKIIQELEAERARLAAAATTGPTAEPGGAAVVSSASQSSSQQNLEMYNIGHKTPRNTAPIPGYDTRLDAQGLRSVLERRSQVDGTPIVETVGEGDSDNEQYYSPGKTPDNGDSLRSRDGFNVLD